MRPPTHLVPARAAAQPGAGRRLRFRWLGVAGIELALDDYVLLVDPCLTRFPIWHLFWGRVEPDSSLVAEKIGQCDDVLITHAHFDHLMDVPEIVRATGATAWGCSNTRQLLLALGVPQHQIRVMSAGDAERLDSVGVEVIAVEHIRFPVFGPGSLPASLHPPLRARDYRMADFFCLRLSTGGVRWLTDPGIRPELAVPADVLFVLPHMADDYYERLLPRVQPKVVIPYHWENFFRPASEPLRPFLMLPQWSCPPVRRVDLVRFQHLVKRIVQDADIFVPQIFQTYELAQPLRFVRSSVE